MSAVLEMLGAKKVGTALVNVEKIEVRDMPRPLNEDYVRQLMELIESGTTLPPVRVRRLKNGKYELLDGWHRLEAYKRAGVMVIEVEIWDVEEGIVYALKVHFNALHGLPLTREQKFEAFKKIIESGQDLTNEMLAKVLGVSVKTIVRWRRRIGIESKTRKLSEEDKRKIVALYKEGYTQQEIAEMMGVAQSSVSEVLANYRNGHLSIPILNDPNNPPSTSFSTSESSQSSADDKVFDATPYLKGGDTEREESEEDEDLEDLEKEVVEELQEEERRVIRVEKRGERLYKVMNEFLDRFSIPEERDALREYIDREIAPLERQLLAEHLRILIPHFHALIGFLIGGVRSENREAR